MIDKNKILFVSRTMPFPVAGGDLIVLENMIKALSEAEFQADLLSFIRSKSDISNIESIKEKFGFKNIYYSKIEPKINPRCVFDWLFKRKSYIFNRFYSKKLSNKILELIKQNEYSTVVFEHAFMYTNVLYNPVLREEIKKRNIKTVINTHVMEYFVLKQALNLNKKELFNFKNYFIKKELEFLKGIELNCIKNADKSIFLGQEDFDRTKNILPDEAHKFCLLEIKPFIEKYSYSPPEFEEKNSIYFLGAFSWVQNYDAAAYFVKEIFPLILNKKPDTKFYLVGMNAGKKIKNFHDGKNIFFIGEKDDIFEEIKKYSVLVVPLRIRGGTRIKILESIAWGKSIISTPEGMEGVASYGESPVLTAETPENFAQKTLDLLTGDSLRLKMKENARGFAEKYYSFEQFKDEVLKIFL